MSRLIDADELYQSIRTDIMGGLNYAHFIEIAPTVDAVPVVHGHWVEIAISKLLYHISFLRCSVCGRSIAKVADMNYCPFCGAKMDDPTQSNDFNTLDALGEKVTE